jgi:group I intron endonuclease
MNNLFCIYMYTSPSGASYIGQTCDMQRRAKYHQRSKGCTAFAAAIEKYGWENFTHKLLEENLTLEEANNRETFWISKLNTLSPNGYNLVTGGGAKGIPSAETRKRMSLASKGHKRNIGVVLSDIAKLNMSIAAIGKPATTKGLVHTIEARAKQSAAKIGNTHCVGRKMSEETRAKISKANIAAWVKRSEREKGVTT